MRERLVVANWKMNGNRAQNERWTEVFRAKAADLSCRAVVCAPSVYLATLPVDAHFELGAQDVNENAKGAFTGEVSAAMLADLGVRWCIVGHSERRTFYGDTDQRVAKKVRALVEAGVRPIVCVGETRAEREAGATETVVLRQLDAVLSLVPAEKLGALAYEPVWAIGTGLTATPETAQAVHAALRAHVERTDEVAAASLPILYGGSVKPSNAAELFAQPDIDGGLIGGAALDPDDFLAVCAAR